MLGRLVLCQAVAAVLAVAQAGGTPLRLKVGTFDPRVEQPSLPERLKSRDTGDARYMVIQLHAGSERTTRKSIGATGTELLQYLPDNAWVARVPSAARQRLATLSGVRWIGPIQPGWKLAPDFGRRGEIAGDSRSVRELSATIDLFPGEAAETARAALVALGLEIRALTRIGTAARLYARGSRDAFERAAHLETVAWIEDRGTARPRNDVATRLVQSGNTAETPLWDRGLHGEGEIVGHIDGAIELDSCYFRDPADNTPGPDHRKIVAYRDGGGFPGDEHGTHTAGSVAGDADPVGGGSTGRGLAWASRLSHTVLELIDGSGSAPSNLYDFLLAAHDDGARVHTNSWGDDSTTAYTTWSRDIDAFSWDHEESLVVFATTNLTTLRSPENAKNSIAVGATGNGGAADMHCSGGSGPTVDGRRKPDVLAPGCGISSAFSLVECGLASDGGTSFAAPAVAAAAALVRQYYREGWYPSGAPLPADERTPSGALIKATLLNGTIDLTGVVGYPTTTEGWGRLLLDDGLHFVGDPRGLVVLEDRRNVDGLATGERRTHLLEVTDPSETLAITLAFTEPPAALLASAATVNDLDLEVRSPDGTLYRGNVFDTLEGISVSGGVADPRNNLERFVLHDPTPGEWTIEVVGAAVNEARQGYALVAAGGVTAVDEGLLRYASHDILDPKPFGNADGFADPGETLRLPLTLVNLGPIPVSGVSARLAAERPDEAAVTEAEQDYLDLDAGATAESPDPHYRVVLATDVPCGTNVPFEVLASHADGDSASGFGLVVGRTRTEPVAEDTPVVMPTFSGTESVSRIEVADSFTITDVDVHVRITHQKVGEIEVRLISPTGTSVLLHDRTASAVPDLDVVFDTERAPDGPGSMGSFVGEDAQGTWTLAVLDEVIGGIPPTPAGTIEEWTLFLEADGAVGCTPFVCEGDPVPAPVDPALTLRSEAGTDLVFEWPALAGATSYRVWRSSRPDFAREQLVGETTATSLTDSDALGDGVNWYYRVRAVNHCGQEGD